MRERRKAGNRVSRRAGTRMPALVLLLLLLGLVPRAAQTAPDAERCERCADRANAVSADDAITACAAAIAAGREKGRALAEFHLLRGMALAQKGAADRALADFEAAIRI